MFNKKFSRRILATFVAVGTFTFTPPVDNFNFVSTVQAEIKTYTGVGACVQSELVTAEQAKNYARLQAEINAKEQAGVYLRGYSKMQNFNLTENKIEVITNSIINVVGDVQYKTEAQVWGNSPIIKYTAILKANIDTDEIIDYIQSTQSDKIISRSPQLNTSSLLKKITNLSERYVKATSQAEKDKIRAEFEQTKKELLAIDKLLEGDEFAFHAAVDIIDENNNIKSKVNYQKAMKFYEEALQLNPKLEAEIYFRRAFNFYRTAEKYDKAIADYSKAIALNPNEPEYYSWRINAYIELEQYDNAIADYNKAIALNPPNVSKYYLGRGNIYSETEKYDKAVSDYSKAIALNHGDIIASYTYSQRGDAYDKLKQYDLAIADYNKAIELNPPEERSDGFYYRRGDIYYHAKQYDKAIDDFTKTLEMNQNFLEAYFERGKSYYDLKQYENAVSDYTKAIQLWGLWYIYIERGKAYYALKQYEKSIADFNQAIKNNNLNGDSYYYRGLCYKALGETKKANADFVKAKKLGYQE